MTESILDILGTPYNNALSVDDNLKAAKLSGWNVRHAPIYAVLPDRDIPLGRVAVMRTNPEDRTKRDILGETSKTYQIYSPEELLHYMMGLRDGLNQSQDLDAELYTMGSLDGGKKVFVSLYLREMGVYLTGLNSYDRTVPLSLQLGIVDALSGGLLNVDMGSVASTRKLYDLVDTDTQGVFQWVASFMNEVDSCYETWSRSYMSRDEVGDVVSRLLGAPEGEAKASTASRYANKTAQAMEYLPPEEEKEGGRYTWLDAMWAAFAWADFSSPVRGAKLGELKTKRAELSLLTPYRKRYARDAIR